MDNLSLFEVCAPKPKVPEPGTQDICCVGCKFWFEKYDVCTNPVGEDWDFPENGKCEFREDGNEQKPRD